MAILFCDLETTIIDLENQDKTRAWAWGVMHETGEFVYGCDIKGYIDYLLKQAIALAAFDEDLTVYFYNLKFDFSFIVHELKDRGIVFSDTNCFRPHKRDNDFVVMTSCISDMGQIYEIDLEGEKTNIKFLDLMNISGGMKLAQWGKQLGLPKGDTPLLTWKDAPTTKEEIKDEWVEYLKRDVEIMRQVYDLFRRAGDVGVTMSGMTLKRFKKQFNAEFAHLAEPSGKPNGKDIPPFDVVFPKLMGDKLDEVAKCVQDAYAGGMVIVNELYQNLEQKKPLKYFDITSSYPHQLESQPMPYGFPTSYYSRKDRDCDYKVKRLLKDKTKVFFGRFHLQGETDMIFPLLNKKKRAYPKVLNGNFALTSVDLQTCIDIDCTLKYTCYELHVFEATDVMFKTYINGLMREKESYDNSDPMRNIPKLLANSLYGKFGSNPIGARKYIEVDLNNPIMKMRTTAPEPRPTVYMPVAAFTTAYGRRQVMAAIMHVGWENFYYCDTDSVTISKELPKEWLGNTLGKWKLEHDLTRACFYGPKRYKIEYKTKTGLDFDVKCIGVNNKEQFTSYDATNLGIGSVLNVTRSKQVKGGKVIYPTRIVISDDLYKIKK